MVGDKFTGKKGTSQNRCCNWKRNKWKIGFLVIIKLNHMIFNQRNTFWKHFIKMTVKGLPWGRTDTTLIKNNDPKI